MTSELTDLRKMIDQMFLTEQNGVGECPGEPFYCEDGAYMANVYGSGEAGAGGTGTTAEVGAGAGASTNIPLMAQVDARAAANLKLKGGRTSPRRGWGQYETLTAELAANLRSAWRDYAHRIQAAYLAERADEAVAYRKRGFSGPKVGFAVHPNGKSAKLLVIWHKDYVPGHGGPAQPASHGATHGHGTTAPRGNVPVAQTRPVGAGVGASAAQPRGFFAWIARLFGRRPAPVATQRYV